jgi:tetratricopeptide (TPR) repeat protein
MRYFYILLIFILGFALGRWSAPEVQPVNAGHDGPHAESDLSQKVSPLEDQKNPKQAEKKSLSPQESSAGQTIDNSHISRKHMQELFSRLMEANNRDDLAEQNKLLAEMESIDPKSEKVFQAKSMILQDQDNWDGAHRVLEECVEAIPNSLFCLRRLANIRSSTTDDKLRYGDDCLRVSPNDPLCLVDVALAYNSKGEFAKAKTYFEIALSLPQGSEGYHRDYILFSYAFALEGLNMHQRATEALMESCKLGNKSACQKLKA